jgi:hypothetical protein
MHGEMLEMPQSILKSASSTRALDIQHAAIAVLMCSLREYQLVHAIPGVQSSHSKQSP